MWDSSVGPIVKRARKIREIQKKIAELKEKKDEMDPDAYKYEMKLLEKELEEAESDYDAAERKTGYKVLSDKPTNWGKILVFAIIFIIAAIIVYTVYIQRVSFGVVR